MFRTLLIIGATAIALGAGFVAWRMPRTPDMIKWWIWVTALTAFAGLFFVAALIADENAWWFLPIIAFSLVSFKAANSWAMADAAKRLLAQESPWLTEIERLAKGDVDTAYFQLDDLREFTLGNSGVLLHNNPHSRHQCIVTTVSGMGLNELIKVAQRHECQEVMAA